MILLPLMYLVGFLVFAGLVGYALLALWGVGYILYRVVYCGGRGIWRMVTVDTRSDRGDRGDKSDRGEDRSDRKDSGDRSDRRSARQSSGQVLSDRVAEHRARLREAQQAAKWTVRLDREGRRIVR